MMHNIAVFHPAPFADITLLPAVSLPTALPCSVQFSCAWETKKRHVDTKLAARRSAEFLNQIQTQKFKFKFDARIKQTLQNKIKQKRPRKQSGISEDRDRERVREAVTISSAFSTFSMRAESADASQNSHDRLFLFCFSNFVTPAQFVNACRMWQG